VIVALVDVVAAAALFNRAGLIEDLVTSDPPGFTELDDADSAVAGALIIHVLLMLTLAVVFIIWQWRHAKNAETLGARGGLDLEQQLFAEVFTTQDARIGVQSFLERGPGHATFTGR